MAEIRALHYKVIVGVAILLTFGSLFLHFAKITDGLAPVLTKAIPNNAKGDATAIRVQGTHVHYSLNQTKVAAIIEPRDVSALLPILLNFISVLPQDWPVVVWGSKDNLPVLQDTRSLRPYIASGKLSLRMLPKGYTKLDSASLSRFLVEPGFWTQHGEAEHMLLFQSDSVLCARSDESMDNWIEYDLVGHPLEWAIDGRGGNGGLSMRRVSSMLRIAKDYQDRLEHAGKKAKWLDYNQWRHLPAKDRRFLFTDEDAWFTHALVDIDDELGDASPVRWPVKDGHSQARFAFDIWLYEGQPIEKVRPLGLHSGRTFAQRLIKYDGKDYDEKSRIWMQYCPEISFWRFVP